MATPHLLSASLRLDGFANHLSPAKKVEQRIRMVLETRPGQIPWRPQFGCDLSSLIGQPANAANLGEARQRIARALDDWLPDVEVEAIDVRVVPRELFGDGLGNASVPVAETAMLKLGVQTSVEVRLQVKADLGPTVVSARLSP